MWNEGTKTFLAGEALAERRRVKIKAGTITTPPEVEYADAEDFIGVTEYGVASGAEVAVKLSNCPGTFETECTIGAAIARGTVLYGAADGKICDTAAGSAQGVAMETGVEGAIIEWAPWNVKATTAGTVSIADAGNKITGVTVEAALAELMTGIKTAQYTIAPSAIRLETGAAVAAFANAGADGFAQLANKELAIRWNDGAAPTKLAFQYVLPQDLDDAAAIVAHFMGAIVKAGGDEADSPTLTVEAYFATAGADPAADTDCGGVSGEFLTNADAAYQEKTLSIAAGDVPPAPCVLTLIVNPTDGQLGTDDFVLQIPWLEVTRKCLTA
jgi:hypothetical protein